MAKGFTHTHVWDQQEGETDNAYSAFKVWIDKDASMKLIDVSRKTGFDYDRVRRWKKLNKWVSRKKEYDKDTCKKVQTKVVNTIAEMKKRQLSVVDSFWQIVQIETKRLIKRIKKAQEIDKLGEPKTELKAILKPKDIREFAKFASELERLNLEQPTSRQETVNVFLDNEQKQKKLRELFLSNERTKDAIDKLQQSIDEEKIEEQVMYNKENEEKIEERKIH